MVAFSVAALAVTACTNHDSIGSDEPSIAAYQGEAQSDQPCDSGLASIAPMLGDTMDTVYEINFAIADQATTQDDLIRGSRDALFRIAGVWRDLGTGSNELARGLVNRIGDAWELGTATVVNDPDGPKRNLLAIASAYDALAVALETCNMWESEVNRLRSEASNLNQFAAALP